MFTIAGILADEEPKTGISASGLYNSSSPSTSDPSYTYSSNLLSGRSEFSIMVWAYVDSSAQSNFNLKPYLESSGITQNIKPIIIKETSVECVISNSNGGITTVGSTTANNKGSFIHLCVTGSVSNNRIRIYRNGTLLSSAVMTYANATSTEAITFSTSLIDLAQLNIYDRELPEEEVSEHYVYDSDTSQAGVLGYDAMTTSQRSGLIYSSSFIDSISFSGNEFKDRSGNDITLSPQPSLTGQQIYVYTDASDLPSDQPNAFAPSVATLDGSSQYYDAGNSFGITTEDFGFSGWFKFNSISSSSVLFGKYINASNQASYYFYWDQTTNELIFDLSTTGVAVTKSLKYSFTPNIGQWYHIATVRESSVYKLYIDNSEVHSESMTDTIYNSNTSFNWGALGSLSLYADVSLFNVNVSVGSAYTTSNIDEMYNSGTPLSYSEHSTSLQSKFTAFNYLGNWTGNTGQETTDQTSNGNDLTAIGSPTYEPTGALIVSDGGVQYNTSYIRYNGSTDLTSWSNSDLISGRSSLTISLNFIANSLIDFGQLFNSDQSGFDNELVIYTYNNGSISIQISSNTQTSSSGLITIGEWHNLLVEFSGSNYFKATLDGAQIINQTSGVPSTIPNYSPTVYQGALFNGSIIKTELFDSILTASEKTELSKVKSYNDYTQTLKDKCISAIPNYNGADVTSGSEFTDQSGNLNDSSNPNSLSIESELAVECDEDPV